MHRTQSPFDHGQQVVAGERHATGEQGGSRITQRVEFAPQVDGDLLKGRLERPTAPVQFGQLPRIGLLGRDVAQQVNLPVAIAGGWFNLTVMRRTVNS
jgi:hypothetical protein